MLVLTHAVVNVFFGGMFIAFGWLSRFVKMVLLAKTESMLAVCLVFGNHGCDRVLERRVVVGEGRVILSIF